MRKTSPQSCGGLGCLAGLVMPWELGACGAGAAPSPLPSSPVSPRGPAPGAPVPVTCFQCLMSKQLIKLEGEIHWLESCLVWLAGLLFRRAAITASVLAVCFTPKPPIHCSVQAAVFSASLPFKSCFGCNYSCQEPRPGISV